jgi:hypothetical protein
MAVSFGFFSDPALTTQISARLQFVQASSSPSPEDKVVYFGSPVAGRFCQANSDPGVDPIVLSIVDATPGAGIPVTDVKLALSSGGLSGATGGAPLNLPDTVYSGIAGAVPVYIRVLDSTHVSALDAGLSITANMLAEFA